MNTYIVHDGRLVADPETIVLKDGKYLIKVRIADNQVGKKDDKRPARFVTLKGFGVQGEQLSKLSKGDVISVVGSLTLEAFEDKTGVKRTADVMVVDKFRVQQSKSFFGDAPKGKEESSLDDLFGAP